MVDALLHASPYRLTKTRALQMLKQRTSGAILICSADLDGNMGMLAKNNIPMIKVSTEGVDLAKQKDRCFVFGISGAKSGIQELVSFARQRFKGELKINIRTSKGSAPVDVDSAKYGKVADVLLERHFLTAGITGFEFAESNKGIYIKSRIGLKLVPFIG